VQLPIPAGSRRRTRHALIAAALLSVVAAVALPSAAQAASISFNDRDGSLFVQDNGTENNELALRVIGDRIVITDSVPFTSFPAFQACRLVNQNQASCFAPLVKHVFVNAFAGNDTVEYRLPHPGTVTLGAGNDRVSAGRREATGRAIAPVRYLPGLFANDPNGDFDTINYAGADRGVRLTPEDNLANDGRPGIDNENVAPGFDVIFGSQFDDSPLFGTDLPEIMNGLGGNDFIAGGHGNDVFQSSFQDGADDYHGGPGRDTIDYAGRTRPVRISLDNVANDGESGERDNVRTNVENLYGGSAGDFFESHGAFSRLDGRGGDDVLLGGAGPDTLIGGPGNDILNSGQGNDHVDSRDGQLDTIDCSQDTDSLVRDRTERSIVDCEIVAIGKLRLAARSARMTAGKTARLKLSWRHPKAWKQLRTIELRLTRDDVPVGAVTIRPRGKKITGSGAVELAAKRSRIAAKGKTVTARLAVRLNASVAGATLKAEVEATDRRGRRQLERNAATIRVAE
jgi:hypothetical protein